MLWISLLQVSMERISPALGGLTQSPILGPAWTDGKQVAQALIEPAKDMVQLFDALTPYVPMLVVS